MPRFYAKLAAAQGVASVVAKAPQALAGVKPVASLAGRKAPQISAAPELFKNLGKIPQPPPISGPLASRLKLVK